MTSERIYHVWLSTKGRAETLQGEIKSDLKRFFADIARRCEIDLIDAEAAPDHVHLVLKIPADKGLSWAMHRLKGASSREMLLKYPDLKSDMMQSAFWQKGYGWRRVEPAHLSAVRNYIRNHPERPYRRE